jgi:hypothetical protein
MSLSREQIQNARLIYSVGKSMGMNTRDIQIALITAMQESRLINVNYGDRDSLGLFQQRPSQGWGTPAQVTDPTYAARKFFSVLKGVENRTSMSMTEAAQAVQRSAYPDAYAAHIKLIRDIYPKISGGVVEKPISRKSNPLSQEPLPTTEVPQQPVMDPMSALGAAYGPLGSPDTVNMMPGMTPQDDWFPIITPSSFEIIKTGDDLGEINLGYGSKGGMKGVDRWRRAVVEAAKTALGTPYQWGGNSLQNGVDCSGLVQQAFARIGIDLPRVSYQQANSGQRVALNKLMPGDLVAWDNSSRNSGADHIAIYIGNGRIIEAPSPGRNVRIRKLGDNEGAWGVRIER